MAIREITEEERRCAELERARRRMVAEAEEKARRWKEAEAARLERVERWRQRWEELRGGMGRLSAVSCVAAGLLIVALCPMPGWYYAGMKAAVFLFGVLAAVVFFRRGAEWRAVLAGLVAVVFNPWVRLGLHKAEWRVADLVCALVVLLFLQLPRGEGK